MINLKQKSTGTAFAILFSIITILCITSIAQAYGTAFTYNGTRIQFKYSIGSTSVNAGQTITVNHHQKRDYPANYGMTVSVMRNTGWGYKSVGSKTFQNDNGGVFSVKAPISGTYKLYFESTYTHGYTFHVYGTVLK
ncbi:hypothetical protein JS528_06370 [Bifidobacterium sp. MA2]|uniref:Uncharacterized protein n=1 Tax=Bifidobacterium santillanense TaxID=2809028 RepID=A0ABS5UQ15_9BIFI|nr:hypothetical protein [Bifidobacterium santillanense]MBT1172985.1 hypothetical protein [Bifidobacterium santillanense]